MRGHHHVSVDKPNLPACDKVTVRSGKTVRTVVETYRDGAELCLVLTDGANPSVEHAKNCKAARVAA